MSGMIYRPLGATGLDVSVIGLGGEWLNERPQAEVTAVIDAAIAGGINYLDVFMPQPETRSRIGQALKGRRDTMLIQGHLCTVCENGQYERTRDREKTRASFDDLRTRLGADHIDVGMIHYVDSAEDFRAVFDHGIIDDALDLKARGVIRHLGISSHNPLVALQAVETGLFEVLMFSINPAYDLEEAETDIYALMDFKDLPPDPAARDWHIDPARRRLYAACARSGVGITVMKALGAGSLLAAETSPFGVPLSVAQCCHYSLTRPGVASALIGCARVEEVHAALGYLTATEAERDYTAVLAGHNKVRMTGRCMYCNHCLPCPARIDIAAVTKYLDLATLHDVVPETVRAHYRALDTHADDCLMCGECEPNCPFKVDIRANMTKARTVFA